MKAIIVPVRHIVQILHADYLCNLLSLRQLLGTDVAQAEMTNQSLPLSSAARSAVLQWIPRWPRDSSNPKIDDIQGVESQISKVVMNAIDQLLARKSMKPGLVVHPGERPPW